MPERPPRRRREVVTFRQTLQRAAVQLDISVEELDRARILGQIALLLTRHPRIGERVAYKGGAVMKLVDGSPRFSADLDGAAVAGREVRRSWIEEALSTPEARRVVLGIPRIVNVSERGIGYPVLECRAIAGHSPITLKLSVNWHAPLLRDPEWRTIEVHGVGEAALPIVDRRERAAEKVRAFLERGEVRDAHDLYHYESRVLLRGDWGALKTLVRRKLHEVGIPWERALVQEFDSRVSQAQREWPGTIVVEGGAPGWDVVERSLMRFKTLLPKDITQGTTTLTGS